jgi:hypothetical protein
MTEVQEESLKRFKRILFLGEHRENILMRLSRHAFVKTPNPEIPIYQLNADDIKALF